MKEALVVWGGWEGHEPEASVACFAPWLKQQGYRVEKRTTLAVFADTETLLNKDLIIPCWTMGKLSTEEEAGLLTAVRAGVGIAGWHGGMGDAFRENTEFQYMVGGQFVAHPGNHREYFVEIVAPEDPIVAGLERFSITSEQYYMHVDPSNEVLATTVFPGLDNPYTAGTVMPQVWKRMWGNGRVFYSAFGHGPADLQVPEVQTIMRRGMLWATRPAPGTDRV